MNDDTEQTSCDHDWQRPYIGPDDWAGAYITAICSKCRAERTNFDDYYENYDAEDEKFD